VTYRCIECPVIIRQVEDDKFIEQAGPSALDADELPDDQPDEAR